MDDADAFFRADAKRLGMTLAEYERKFSVQLKGGPAENRIKYHENLAGLMSDSDIARAEAFERGFTRERLHKRRRDRSRRPSASVDQPDERVA